MKLVIVESPAKAKTIQKYLGGDFAVKSSYGHVRDLPKTQMGVDIEHDFQPHYVIPKKAKEHLNDLKKAAARAETIYFATDEDREGEAIAWHLIEALKPPAAKVKRVTFTEITKTAVQKAIEAPRAIDQHLVDAQQARRILDRLVGYELSPLLWKKVRRGLSAGRVQSVAVRLIVEREEEIKKFKTQEYWTITAKFLKDQHRFDAKLHQIAGKLIPKMGIKDKASADKILADLKDATYTVVDLKTQERRRTPPPPFTTSTLQQAAVHQLGFSSKRTMALAQQLYEGVDVGAEGPVGLITYMRTDSLNLSAEATGRAVVVIQREFGANYALSSPRRYANKSKGAQEAHEAIRPTDPARLPKDVERYLEPAAYKLYRLIWQRMLASQMAEARLNLTVADIKAGDAMLRATGTTVIFDGFVKALGERAAFKEIILPALAKNDELKLEKLLPEQHFTQPPARYSEATLVKALEEHGIGRPSTYAPTIDVIQRREYVQKNEEKRFAPTEVGTLVNSVLTEHFPKIVDIAFTANMEQDLDTIAAGGKQWQPVIKAFYHPFHDLIEAKGKELKKSDLTQEKTGEACPTCQHGELVIKLGRFGKFKACNRYPECKHTEPIGEEKKIQEEITGEKCPECGRPLVLKRGKFGPFLGCSGYPECKYIKKIEKGTGVTCPECGQGEIIEKRSKSGKTFYACNRYPECKNAYWSKPTGEACPTCGRLLLFGAKNTIRCSNKECGFTRPA